MALDFSVRCPIHLLAVATHPWVNVDALIDSTMVGVFVPES